MLILCLFVSAAVLFLPFRPWTRMLSAGGDCRKGYPAQLAAAHLTGFIKSGFVGFNLAGTFKKNKKEEGNFMIHGITAGKSFFCLFFF